jgi:hypothetical protein
MWCDKLCRGSIRHLLVECPNVKQFRDVLVRDGLLSGLSIFKNNGFFLSSYETDTVCLLSPPRTLKALNSFVDCTSGSMGLFGSFRKKPSDPFQAAVEQQRRRTPAGTLRSRQSESAYRRNADYFHGGGPFAWQEGPHEHPYEQPGFGFYSGENLSAAGPQIQETKRSLSEDDGFRDAQQGFLPGSLGPDLPFSPHWRYPGPTTRPIGWNEAGYDTESPLWIDPEPHVGTRPWDWPYHGPEEEFLHSESHYFNPYRPSTREPLMARRSSLSGRALPARNSPFNMSSNRERPVLDTFRPSNPYAPDRSFNRNFVQDRSHTWNPLGRRNGSPFSGSRPPPHPPGSYERLRPLHLQRGDSGAGNGGGRGGRSSSRLGEVRYP